MKPYWLAFGVGVICLSDPWGTISGSQGLAFASERCPADAQFLSLAGRCGAITEDGCASADVSGPESGAALSAPGRTPDRSDDAGVNFVLQNDSAQVLFLPEAPGRGQITFTLSRSGEPLMLPDTQFCPNWCPDRGPVMELDCRAPVPTLVALPPQQRIDFAWSGELAVPMIRACDSGAEMHCLSRRRARSGEYEVQVCAYPSMTGSAREFKEVTRLERVEAAGEPVCASRVLQHPAPGPVVLRMNVDNRQ